VRRSVTRHVLTPMCLHTIANRRSGSGWLASWLAGRPAGCLRTAGWLAQGWLAGWLAHGWLRAQCPASEPLSQPAIQPTNQTTPTYPARSERAAVLNAKALIQSRTMQSRS